jgi:hypothetical protein
MKFINFSKKTIEFKTIAISYSQDSEYNIIIDKSLEILKLLEVNFRFIIVEIGGSAYRKNHNHGISPSHLKELSLVDALFYLSEENNKNDIYNVDNYLPIALSNKIQLEQFILINNSNNASWVDCIKYKINKYDQGLNIIEANILKHLLSIEVTINNKDNLTRAINSSKISLLGKSSIFVCTNPSYIVASIIALIQHFNYSNQKLETLKEIFIKTILHNSNKNPIFLLEEILCQFKKDLNKNNNNYVEQNNILYHIANQDIKTNIAANEEKTELLILQYISKEESFDYKKIKLEGKFIVATIVRYFKYKQSHKYLIINIMSQDNIEVYPNEAFWENIVTDPIITIRNIYNI